MGSVHTFERRVDDWPVEGARDRARQLKCLIETALGLSRRMQWHGQQRIGKRMIMLLITEEHEVGQQTREQSAVDQLIVILERGYQTVHWKAIQKGADNLSESRSMLLALPAKLVGKRQRQRTLTAAVTQPGQVIAARLADAMLNRMPCAQTEQAGT